MFVQGRQILEGIDLVQLTGVDQTHEQIPHMSSIVGLVEVGILTMQNHFFERGFADIVVQGRSGLAQEQRQGLPVVEHVGNGFAERAVGLDLMMFDLFGQPGLQFGHLGAAVGLMEGQSLFRGQALVFGLGIIRVDLLEDLQDPQALLGEVRRHLHKPPPSVGQTKHRTSESGDPTLQRVASARFPDSPRHGGDR
jgi:hypothetical protein